MPLAADNADNRQTVSHSAASAVSYLGIFMMVVHVDVQ